MLYIFINNEVISKSIVKHCQMTFPIKALVRSFSTSSAASSSRWFMPPLPVWPASASVDF